jgi:hypothetical protein
MFYGTEAKGANNDFFAPQRNIVMPTATRSLLEALALEDGDTESRLNLIKRVLGRSGTVVFGKLDPRSPQASVRGKELGAYSTIPQDGPYKLTSVSIFSPDKSDKISIQFRNQDPSAQPTLTESLVIIDSVTGVFQDESFERQFRPGIGWQGAETASLSVGLIDQSPIIPVIAKTILEHF